MEIILLENIRNLGKLGDQVRVKRGYARNFLYPQSKAVPATADNIKKFEARRAELEAAQAKAKDDAQKRAERFKDISLNIKALAGDEGKLYGSIGVREIVEALNGKGYEVAKSEITLPEGPIRNTGEFAVDIQLYTDITVNIKVIVEAEHAA